MLLDSLIPLGRLITPWQLLVGTCLVVVAEETVAENQDFQRGKLLKRYLKMWLKVIFKSSLSICAESLKKRKIP